MKKTTLIPESKMRPEDRARQSIPWKEMKVGGIYQRKDGRYFIFCGRATAYHVFDETTVRISDKLCYVYVYVDAPLVLSKSLDEDSLDIICSSAKLRTSEYRDIAKVYIGMLPNFTKQSSWFFRNFMVITDPNQRPKGSFKAKIKYTEEATAQLQTFIAKQTTKSRKRAAKSKQGAANK